MKVIKFPQEEKLTANEVLERAKDQFEEVLIMGWRSNADGEKEFAYVNTSATYGELMWNVELFKQYLLNE